MRANFQSQSTAMLGTEGREQLSSQARRPLLLPRRRSSRRGSAGSGAVPGEGQRAGGTAPAACAGELRCSAAASCTSGLWELVRLSRALPKIRLKWTQGQLKSTGDGLLTSVAFDPGGALNALVSARLGAPAPAAPAPPSSAPLTSTRRCFPARFCSR